MNIAILSGKGGTGKTTVSTNISLAMKANYIDCDVEEPNGFIFLKPTNISMKEVLIDYPFIDDSKCTYCGECAKICQFNALAVVKKDILLFEKLCHGCGACQAVCKFNAVTYRKRKIGVIEEGKYKDIICRRGILDIGEPMAVPIIRQLLDDMPKGTNIVDCSPGTSCNVVSTLQYMEAAILVTEPTEFGLHDLKMAVEVVKMSKIPFGIIINKQISEKNIISDYCTKEKINILGSIPYDRSAAESYSKGNMLIENEKFKKSFEHILKGVKEAFKWN